MGGFRYTTFVARFAVFFAAVVAQAAEPQYVFSRWEGPGFTYDCAWPGERIELSAAHAMFPANKRPGEGVIVGIVDTGYLPSEAIVDDGSLPQRGVISREFDFGRSLVLQNFLEGGEPFDVSWTSPNNGHGTMVAIVIGGISQSPAVVQTGWKSVAPWVRLLPIRVTTDVVIYQGTEENRVKRLANGIVAAMNGGARVVNVSLAALHDVNGHIRRAVETAEARGVIVVSASAQYSPISFLPFPGRYSTVVSTTASTQNDTMWPSAAKHKGLKIAAPGADICAPRVVNAEDGEWAVNSRGERMRWRHAFVAGGRGTTYSTAFVSGAAALWLSYHGPENLAARYGQRNVAKVFRKVLLTQGFDTPENWDSEKSGRGILNVRKLLEAPLPARLD
jgi:serine protease